MEFIIIIFICLIMLLILQWVYDYSIKKIEKTVDDKKLNELTNRLPDNENICKSILKKLKNEDVKIKVAKEEENSKTSLYVAITNTIFIANIKDSYTRIQTIAHECLHSIQDKRILLFNFYFTNVYLIYYLIAIILTTIGVFRNYILQITIITILGFIHFAVRSYLENDAMTKARYLAEEYLEDSQICSKKEIKELTDKYDEINRIGIPAYNFVLLRGCIIKIIVYTLICFCLFL